MGCDIISFSWFDANRVSRKEKTWTCILFLTDFCEPFQKLLKCVPRNGNMYFNPSKELTRPFFTARRLTTSTSGTWTYSWMRPPSMEIALSLRDENTLWLACKRFLLKCRTESLEGVIRKATWRYQTGVSDFKTPVDLHALGSLSVLVGSYHLHLSVWDKFSRSLVTYQLESHKCEYPRLWSMGNQHLQSRTLLLCLKAELSGRLIDWLFHLTVRQVPRLVATLHAQQAATNYVSQRLHTSSLFPLHLPALDRLFYLLSVGSHFGRKIFIGRISHEYIIMRHYCNHQH